MGLDSALDIARSGLVAIQRNLDLVSQNIGNAKTPGYTRKTLVQESLFDAGGPSGVRVDGVQREVDMAVLSRLDRSRADVAAATTREAALQGIELAHGTTDAGSTIADGITGLLNGFTALAAAPADAGQQQATWFAAGTLAQRLNGVAEAVGKARQEAQGGIETDVATANAALREIAGLTDEIRARQGIETVALEDKRDAAVARLANVIPANIVRRPNGDVQLITLNGILLPLDPNKDLLQVASAVTAPAAYYGAGGSLPGVTLNGTDITTQLSGGSLAEQIGLRDKILPRYQSELDLTAATLAYRFNAEGLALFTDRDGSTVPDVTQPYAGSNQVGFAARIMTNPAIGNNPALLRDGTHAIAGSPTGPSAFTPNPTGGPAGFTTLIDRVRNYALGSEAAAGVAWSGIATAGLGPDGSLASPFIAPSAIGDYAARMTSAQVGDRAAASDAKDRAGTLRDALQAKFNTRAGIDTDQEMANMVTLQNAYAANARVISTIQSMWSSLLAIGS
jgi:flagellar hook-associated protein 1